MTPLVAGEIKVAFALTEPAAGTGADLRCSVEREGDTYYVSGEKHLITFGCSADYLLLIARLRARGRRGHGRADDARPRRGRRRALMPEIDGRARHRSRPLVFDRAPVPVANRLGEEGDGLEVALGGFLAPEPDLAGDDVASAWPSARSSWPSPTPRRRETFGRKLAERQAIAFKLAEMATDIEAARALVLHAARPGRATPEAIAAVIDGEAVRRRDAAAGDRRGARHPRRDRVLLASRSSASTATRAPSASRRARPRSRR